MKRIVLAVIASAVIALSWTQQSDAARPDITRFEIAPTVLVKRGAGRPSRVLAVTIENVGEPVSGNITARIGGKNLTFDPFSIGKGTNTYLIDIPEVQTETKASFILRTPAGKRTCTATIAPQRRQWMVYLFHHSHSDIGYTELQTRVATNHAAYLDSVISYCRRTDGYPDDAKFRWNVEITWSLEQLMRTRPDNRVRELMELVRAGRVEIGAWYLNMTDLYSHEELVRNLYLSRELANRWDIDITCAMNNDVNGFAWGAPQVLSKAGVRYFATGINETRSRAPLDRPCAFRWESPDGSSILHWNGEHYLFANYALHIHEGCNACAPYLADYLGKLQARTDYPYNITAMNVSAWVTDNCPPGFGLSDVVREWNERYESPRLRLATMREFFTELEKGWGGSIPVYRLGWPDYWTDGVASTSYETGLNRVTHADLITAEKTCALASAIDPLFTYPVAEIDETYRLAMLYDEHTWGAYNSISEPWSELARSQWTIKSGFAYRAREQSRHLLGQGLAALAEHIPFTGPNTLAVVNPLSWARTDMVRTSLPAALAGVKGAFVLSDLRTGARVPFQITKDGDMLFIARDVPSLGYALYCATPDSTAAQKPGVLDASGGIIENAFYRVVLDPVTGGVKSIMDKELGAELVDQGAKYAFNGWVYETPQGDRAAVDNMAKSAVFTRSSPTSASFSTGLDGPAAWSIIAKAAAKPCPSIEQEVILYDGLKRIDIVNKLMKDEVYEPEALYYAFPFSVKNPVVRMEVADAIMIPEKEQLPKTTRDWMTAQHFVETSGSDHTVVWSPFEAPLVQFGDINTGKWLTHLDITNAHIYSYALNNYWFTNFKAAQGGFITLRYSITSRAGGSDLAGSSRFGWERHTPLAAVWAPEKGTKNLPEAAQGFVTVDTPAVIIQAFKCAENGNGWIVRLREVAGKDADATVSISLPGLGIAAAVCTDILERDKEPLTVSGNSFMVKIKGFGMETIRVTKN